MLGQLADVAAVDHGVQVQVQVDQAVPVGVDVAVRDQESQADPVLGLATPIGRVIGVPALDPEDVRNDRAAAHVMLRPVAQRIC